MKLPLFALWLLLSSWPLAFLSTFGEANQADSLERLLNFRRPEEPLLAQPWPELHATNDYPVAFVEPQHGLIKVDKISTPLPGQPYDVDLEQYSGYVTVDPVAGRAMFYHFVESPQNSSTKPLVLWLNGVATVIFLESPAGVGLLYSNTSSNYDSAADINTIEDVYVLLINWLERFPQYRTRHFFKIEKSYAGHYVPQLAYIVM